MKPSQILALLACAEGLKEVINAAGNDQPYNRDELEKEFAPLLGKLYEAGVRLGGEL